MDQHFFEFRDLPRLITPGDLFETRYIHTDNISVAVNLMKAGAEVPSHRHLHETIDLVEEGELEMTIDGKTERMKAGMIARVPSHITHSARAITACKVINIFYPKRDDFKN